MIWLSFTIFSPQLRVDLKNFLAKAVEAAGLTEGDLPDTIRPHLVPPREVTDGFDLTTLRERMKYFAKHSNLSYREIGEQMGIEDSEEARSKVTTFSTGQKTPNCLPSCDSAEQ